MNDILSLIGEALTHAGEDQQLVERLSHLEDRRITPNKDLPQMEFLFRLFGRPCFPRGELVALTGKPKSGKTFVSSILMTLCFRQEALSVQRESPETLRVLWYDTEQSDESTQDILKNRIMPMIREKEMADESVCKDNSLWESIGECFNIFNVRQDPWRDRTPLLQTAVERYKPDLVIVDGIRDLVNDINDGVLAQETVEGLMRMASEQHCCVVCILHQNKSAEDKNLRGWIGTELTHKSFEVYECEKSEDRIFSLSQKLTRKYDILDTLHYVVDEQGIPQLATVEALLENEKGQRQPNETSRPMLNKVYIKDWDGHKPIYDLPTLFADALPEEGKLYVAKDMQETVMKLTNITSVYFYNRIREQALNEHVIVKSADEFDHISYYRPRKEAPDTVKVGKNGEQMTLFDGSLGDVPF